MSDMEDNIDNGDIGDLLVPEISMNTDDAPLELNENEDAAEPDKEIPTEEQNGAVPDEDQDSSSTKITSNEIDHEPDNSKQENGNPDQIPEVYTLEEVDVYNKLYVPGEQAVQFLRAHCTACNVHLGSAPNKENKRFIHPLLKVLICKNCFVFYGSGDFDKDEDGSELYCRWCGQGGKVLCCAQCPYVFCQRCIRVNLGKKVLNTVKESDDWMCFVCSPEQIISARVYCRALYDFVQDEFRLATELKQPERLTTDNSLCCVNRQKITAAPKRKRSNSAVRPYDELLDNDDAYHKKKKVKLTILSHMLTTTNENRPPNNTFAASMAQKVWQSEVEDEVVCTPDLSLLMDDEESSVLTPNASPQPSPSPQPSCSTLPFVQATPPLGPPSPPLHADLNSAKDSDIQYIGQTRVVNYPVVKPVAKPVGANRTYAARANALGYRLPSKPPVILNTSTNKPLTTPNFVQLQAPSVRFPNMNQPVVRVSHNRNNSVIDTSMPARLAPGLRYEWFEKATQFTARVNQNLSTRLCSLSKDQSTVASLEGLAGIHNNLQEILSNSINSLMQIRKTLRTDFIAGLKKLKFCKTDDNIAPPQPPEDNDVIIVDSHVPSAPTPAPVTNSTDERPRGYIKVKPPSELLDASIITIPDDNVATAFSAHEDNDLSVPAVMPTEVSTADDAPAASQNAENPSDGKEPQASSYINTNEALSEISEVLNPETVSLIKRALVESKFETIVNDNLKLTVRNISPQLLKRMLSVRVTVETNFGAATPRTRPLKGYKAMNIAAVDEQDIEQMLSSSVVVNTSKRKAFDDSFSAFVANMAQLSQDGGTETCESRASTEGKPHDSVEVNRLNKSSLQSVSENEESSHDPQTTDSGIDVDGEQSLSNGIATCQDN